MEFTKSGISRSRKAAPVAAEALNLIESASEEKDPGGAAPVVQHVFVRSSRRSEQRVAGAEKRNGHRAVHGSRSHSH